MFIFRKSAYCLRIVSVYIFLTLTSVQIYSTFFFSGDMHPRAMVCYIRELLIHWLYVVAYLNLVKFQTLFHQAHCAIYHG